jgi:hypothetical protein
LEVGTRVSSRWDKTIFIGKGNILEDDIDEELFAQYKKKTERTMKIVVAMFAVVLLFVLYTLVRSG